MVTAGFLELVKISEQICIFWRPGVPRHIFIVEEPSGSRQIPKVPPNRHILRRDRAARVGLRGLPVRFDEAQFGCRCGADIGEVLRLVAGRFRRDFGVLRCGCGRCRRIFRGKGVRLADFRVVFRNLCGPRRARGFIRLPFRHLFRVVGVPFAQSRRVDADIHVHGELVQRGDKRLVQVLVDHLLLRFQTVERQHVKPFLIAHQSVRRFREIRNLG